MINRQAIQTTKHNGMETREIEMSCWTKPELENMLEDVVNELDLSDSMIEEHGPLGTPPSELVRLVLERKDLEIKMLQAGFKDCAQH